MDFIAMFRTHSAEFPDMQVEYFAEVDVSDSFSSVELLSIEMRYYLFTGGAHGYGGTKYFNFDARTGEMYEPLAVFEDLEGFERYAESAFRSKFDRIGG